MNSGESVNRAAAVRAVGGERNAVRAEQLRAQGRNDRSISEQLGIDGEAIARWFDLQDVLAVGANLDGAA